MDNQNLNFNSNAMTNDHQEVFIPNGQSLSSTEGVKWIGQAWQLVKNKWGMWILLYIIYTLWISRCIATARERIPGSIGNYVTGVSECSQQRGNLKDNGYILYV
ncbi:MULTISPECIES: hypothetical protein [Photorhabdus]|uniref:hypothetical protein n=1 Tax=Photorhabdus TaxID=29487 RepID=UPI00059CAECD|nr:MULTISPECIES: hypothetical protein [Photorhabdus]AWK41458.1 hypothetical protein A4R40_08140 [Photorhabdus laumondii subsp. laumondii]MCC8386510.1 hypothetical protein [Photorhabdus laumondii]MCC8415662.1 hypothetical protein [Photorhabdus laumondii]